LLVEGDPIRGLQWKVAAADISRSVREELKRLSALPQVHVAAARDPATSLPGQSGHPDAVWGREHGVESDGPRTPKLPGELAADMLAALAGLGWSRAEAEKRLEQAWDRLLLAGNDAGAIPVEKLLREAIRGAA
jgi:hypothetical protein